jgi:hypothetical protein
MSFKYFLDMNPEDEVINPSSLTKFRKLRLKDTDLLDLLINKTVTIAVEKGIIPSKSIVVDATHTLSGSNPFLEIYKFDSCSEREIKLVKAKTNLYNLSIKNSCKK